MVVFIWIILEKNSYWILMKISSAGTRVLAEHFPQKMKGHSKSDTGEIVFLKKMWNRVMTCVCNR